MTLWPTRTSDAVAGSPLFSNVVAESTVITIELEPAARRPAP